MTTSEIENVEDGGRSIGRSRQRQRPTSAFSPLHLAYLAVLVLAIVPFGSTGPFAGTLTPISIAILTILVVSLRPNAGITRGVERVAWLVGVGLALYVGLQVTGAFGLLPAHPIWRRASAALGETLPGLPAVDPTASIAALPTILAPFLMFIAGLRIAQNRGGALALLEAIGLLGGFIAIAGLLQFALAPDLLLLSPKSSYLDSLTGVFVNRNTAATYFGCNVLLLYALLDREFRHASNWVSGLFAALEPSRRPRSLKPIVYALLLAASVLALLLTKSRAGIACSSLALFVEACLLARRGDSRFGWIATFLGTALAIGVVLVVFGGQTIYRAEMRGINDGRFCVLPGVLAAARDNFPFGTGPGSFPLVFQAHRDPACGIYGTWQRAHNFFLEGSITLGAVFWIAATTCTLALLFALSRGLRHRRRFRFVPVMGLSLLLLLVLHDLIDFSLQIPGMAMTAAAIFAACVVVSLEQSGRTTIDGG